MRGEITMSKFLGKRLRYLRDKRGLSQKFVAEKFGIANNTLSGYEAGDRNPSPELIAKFADFYEVTTDYLLGNTDSMYRTKDQDEFIKSADKTIEELRDFYNITYEGKEISDDELKGMLAWVKANRMMNDSHKK
jgi:transcriptional regulator with XRE-family HTH domain